MAASAPAVVVGSLNMDLVMRVQRLPEAGETMFGLGFSQAEGGKGANQAVAAARLGASVAMVGCVGADAFGAQLRAALAKDGVDTRHLGTASAAPTGVAMILVEEGGENRIVLSPGANLALTTYDIDRAAAIICRAPLLVVQLEIPLPVVYDAIISAVCARVPVLLNPAPAATLPDELWHSIDYLVPNETEATLLTGIVVQDRASAAKAARVLRQRGVRHVLITMGAQGVLIADAQGERYLPAQKVAATDTTAAGDCFIGGVVAGLCEGMALEQAARLGIAAASLCVTRPGAQTALPYRAELIGDEGMSP